MVLLSLVISFFVGADLVDQADSRTLLKPHPSQPLLNEVVIFEPIANHTFNLKSRNHCGNGSLVQESETAIECQMSAPGTSQLELYVCDAQKTFCRREQLSLTTQSPEGLLNWVKYYLSALNPQRWNSSFKSGVSQVEVVEGFVANDFKKPLEQAKKEDKRIFAFFTQISCPPCRLMKEMTMASNEFKESLKDTIKIQIDIDQDVAPDLVKPLAIRGTPTIIIFDKNFRELDRSVAVRSPLEFKNWMAQLAQEPISEVAKKEPSELGDLERLRLVRWFAQTEAKPLSEFSGRKYLEAIQSSSTEVQAWRTLVSAAGKKTAVERVQTLRNLQLGNPALSDEVWLAYAEMLTQILLEADWSRERDLFNATLREYARGETLIKDSKSDDLQKAYALKTHYSVLAHVYRRQGRMSDVHKAQAKLREVVERFPKLPGVSETTQLDLIKADASTDAPAREKTYADLKEKNKNDYSYDFWEASQALEQKNYNRALSKIDESLKIAKDRSWQKAFLLKLDILSAMKRDAEASDAIQATLADIKLPADRKMKVHGFVQSLRDRERQLQR